MSHHHHTDLPRPVLVGAGAVILFTILAAAFGRFTGIGVTELPPGTVLIERQLRFEEVAGGGLVAYDAASGALIDSIDTREQGFVRGVLRGFARQRQLGGVGREPPLRLVRWTDGRLSLEDDTTGRYVALEAFGPTNAAAFARLLPLYESAGNDTAARTTASMPDPSTEATGRGAEDVRRQRS